MSDLMAFGLWVLLTMSFAAALALWGRVWWEVKSREVAEPSKAAKAPKDTESLEDAFVKHREALAKARQKLFKVEGSLAYRQGVYAAKMVDDMWTLGDQREVDRRMENLRMYAETGGQEYRLLKREREAWERANPLSWAV